MPGKKLSKDEFIKKYQPVVQKVLFERDKDGVNTKVHPTTVLIQMAVESGWKDFDPDSTSFGIKKWKDDQPVNVIKTKEEKDGVVSEIKAEFVRSENIEEAILGYVDFIESNPRYQKALETYTPKEQLKGIADAGYATGSKYAETLESVHKDTQDIRNEVSKVTDENPNAYDDLWKGQENLRKDVEPEKENFVLGSDEKGQYVDILVDKGWENEEYRRQYVKGADQLSFRTIGSNQYLVKGYTDDDGNLQTEYWQAYNRGAKKGQITKFNKEDVYKKEIDAVTGNGENLTPESVAKAEDILLTAKQDYELGGDENKNIRDQKLLNIRSHYYQNAKMPYIKKDIGNMKKAKQQKLFDLETKYANAFGDEKAKLGEELALAKEEYNDALDAEKTTNELIQSVYDKQKEGADKLNVAQWDFSGQAMDALKEKSPHLYATLIKNSANLFEGIDNEYKKYTQTDSYLDYEKSQEKPTDLNKVVLDNDGKVKSGSGSGSSSASSSASGGSTPDTTKGTRPDPNDMDADDADTIGDDTFVDKDGIQKMIDEIDEQLANQDKAEEFTPDLSMLEKKGIDKYSNLVSNATDIARGIIGAQGVFEDVPEYETTGEFEGQVAEAIRMGQMGLTAGELAYRERLANEAYAYDVKNIRNLAGGSAGLALGNMGRAARTLQRRNAEIASEDSQVRRINQSRADRMAMAKEGTNRQKFTDQWKETMMNKEAGAALVRDSFKNMQERSDFERQYGEGSVYNELMKETLKEKQSNTHALKMAQQYQAERQKAWLEDRKTKLQEKIS